MKLRDFFDEKGSDLDGILQTYGDWGVVKPHGWDEKFRNPTYATTPQPEQPKEETKCQEETETRKEQDGSKSVSAGEIQHGKPSTTGGTEMKTIRQMFNEAMGPDFRWWQGSPDYWEGQEHKMACWLGDFLQEYGDYEPAPPRKEQPKKEYKAREWAGPMYESLPEDAKLEPKQPKPEPEAWGELRAYLGKPPWGHCEPVKSAEAAWPEIERRVQKILKCW